MKDIDDIVEIVDVIMPKKVDKVVFFCEVEDNASECCYYVFRNQEVKQCYALVEDESVDSLLLNNTLKKMADYIRQTQTYVNGKRNVVTIIIEGTSEKIKTQVYEKSIGLYQLKKEWKEKYLTV
jgi:hypothetical protein